MTSTLENSKTSAATSQKVLGLIAGDGKLPAILANAAQDKGYKVVVFALSEYARDSVRKVVSKVHLIAVGQLGKNAQLFRSEGIKEAVFVGKVPKLNLLRNITKFDWTAVKELSKLPNLNDDSIQFAMGDFMASNGVKVLTQSEFLRDLFPGVGVLTNRQPTPEEYGDIHYGLSVAREIARVDIGQTVIVRDRMILAIEAIEGTDEAIKRAVGYARKPVVVVKVAKPNQDQRFDIPTVGINTLQCMTGKEPGGVLAVEARETMVVEQDEMVKYCNQHGMSMVAVARD
jgi:UDP-2,3-diacylglucosamine hydrolase